MLLPVIETPSGAVDGSNTVFQLVVPYVSGTPVVFLNGFAKRRDFDDGWTELGSNKLKMKVPPEIGDTISVYYVPA